jgi:hypothetical protein
MRWLFPDGFVGDDPSSKYNARILLIIFAFGIIGLILAVIGDALPPRRLQ